MRDELEDVGKAVSIDTTANDHRDGGHDPLADAVRHNVSVANRCHGRDAPCAASGFETYCVSSEGKREARTNKERRDERTRSHLTVKSHDVPIKVRIVLDTVKENPVWRTEFDVFQRNGMEDAGRPVGDKDDKAEELGNRRDRVLDEKCLFPAIHDRGEARESEELDNLKDSQHSERAQELGSAIHGACGLGVWIGSRNDHEFVGKARDQVDEKPTLVDVGRLDLGAVELDEVVFGHESRVEVEVDIEEEE